MKDLGGASYILRMRIYRDRSKRLLGLSQSTYIDTVLKRFSMKNFKKGYLPIGHGFSLSKRIVRQHLKRESVWVEFICFSSEIYHVPYDMYMIRCGILTRGSE